MLARAESRRAWRTLLALGLLAGVTLGIALAATQVARRTSTAYDRLVEATGAPDAVVLVLGDEQRARAVTRLPEVAESWATDGGVGSDRPWPARVPRRLRRHRGRRRPGCSPRSSSTVTPPIPTRRPTSSSPSALARELGVRGGRPSYRCRSSRARRSREFDTGFGDPDGPSLPCGSSGSCASSTTTSRTRPRRSRPRRWPAASSPSGSSAPDVFVRLRGGPDAVPAFRAVGAAARDRIATRRRCRRVPRLPGALTVAAARRGRRDDAGARRRTPRVRADDRARRTARVAC